MVDPIEVNGLEFGRLLVLGTFVRDDVPRRDHRQLHVECACGYTFTIPARIVLAGKQSMCKRCHALFIERHGTRPEREPVTLADIREQAADRDHDHNEYLRLKEALGL